MVDDKVGMLLLGLRTDTASIATDEESVTAERAVRADLVEWRRTHAGTWPELTEAGLEALTEWLDPESRAELGLSCEAAE